MKAELDMMVFLNSLTKELSLSCEINTCFCIQFYRPVNEGKHKNLKKPDMNSLNKVLLRDTKIFFSKTRFINIHTHFFSSVSI